MADTLFYKFVAFFSLFTAVVAFWPGSGSVTGWAAFTATVQAGPGAWMPSFPATPGSDVTVQPDLPNWTMPERLYLNDSGTDIPCAGYPGQALVEDVPTEQTIWTKYSIYPSYVPLLYTKQFTNTSGDFHLQFTEGVWDFTIYYTAGPTGPHGMHYSISFFLYAEGPACPGIGYQIWRDNVNLTVPYDVTVRKHDFSFHSFLPVNLESGGALVLTVQVWSAWDTLGNLDNAHPIRFVTNPTHQSFIKYPNWQPIWNGPDNSVSGDCDMLCQIGNALAWVAWFFLAIGWVVIAIIVTIAWFFYALILFFAGLFSLSISGTFGPFGPMIGIVTIVFLVYVFLMLVRLIRGTSGSLGV